MAPTGREGEDVVIEISEALWLMVKVPEHDDDIMQLHDSTGRDVFIHRDDIPRLIEELHKVEEAPELT